ncbi:MAG: class I SAM-dependent methyltransferase [Gemmataceae bacterium]|nr:class I SAM-dependent methyltransferase [Gemmataceae bacterium]
MSEDLPRLYTELASWWPLLSAPAEYAEEAAVYHRVLVESSPSPPRTLLELGSGGGNTASHLKAHFAMTLVDRAPAMLAVSRVLNPQCEHVEGDLRRVRLGRHFDAVFVHDAIMYVTTEDDLRRAMETAFVHCRPGGVALFVPDCVRETFRPTTDCGGHDGEGRGLRYLEWAWDPDPADSSYQAEYAYLLREGDGAVRVVQDRHVLGLFARADWLRLLAEVGFRPRALPSDDNSPEPKTGVMFLGLRPGSESEVRVHGS